MEFGKELHIHIDQANHCHERDTERFLDVLDKIDPKIDRSNFVVWLVHVISPSTFPDTRFNEIVERILKHNIGIITCPSGAISMRQIRPIQSPISNSIARVLDFLAAGIPVRIGSDNICDITMPMGTCDLMHELFVMANALRFYNVDVLAHLAAGLELSPELQKLVRNHLEDDRQEIEKVLQRYDIQ